MVAMEGPGELFGGCVGAAGWLAFDFGFLAGLGTGADVAGFGLGGAGWVGTTGGEVGSVD